MSAVIACWAVVAADGMVIQSYMRRRQAYAHAHGHNLISRDRFRVIRMVEA